MKKIVTSKGKKWFSKQPLIFILLLYLCFVCAYCYLSYKSSKRTKIHFSKMTILIAPWGGESSCAQRVKVEAFVYALLKMVDSTVQVTETCKIGGFSQKVVLLNYAVPLVCAQIQAKRKHQKKRIHYF